MELSSSNFQALLSGLGPQYFLKKIFKKIEGQI